MSQPFTGDNVDFPSELPGFSWPTAVVSGQRDLRTPRPFAERAVSLLPDAVLVPLAETGHSSMATHQLAAPHVAHHVERESIDGLSHRADRIAQLPRTGASGRWGS